MSQGRQFTGAAGPHPVVGVSVAIPARDAVATIVEQINAVLAQECPVAFEVIVADNGSRDGTRAAVATIAARDERVRIIDATQAPGEAGARNVAVEACRSNLVAFCDADDVVRPGWLTAVYGALAAGAHAAVVTREQWSLNPGFEGRAVPETVITRWVAGGAFAVRRGLYLQLGGFDTSLPTAADTEFGFRLFDRMGRHPQEVPMAVVSVRLPHDLGTLFRRARRLSRVRDQLRRRHPGHLSARTIDVARFRVELLRRLTIGDPGLANSRTAGWLEVAGTLVGDVEGSVSARITRGFRRT